MRFCSACGARFSQEAAFCPHDGSPTQVLPEDEGTADPLLGRVLDGRYRIDAPLGEGGMGVVYAATHTVLGKRLALKVLRGELAKDPDVVTRFTQEAQAASSIGHPNIIDVSDIGTLPDGTAYFAMEHLEGEPLSSRIATEGPMPVDETIRIAEHIASALGAAHARGIVHRDLKPDNVFLVARPEGPADVKVLDFGVAKVGGAASKLTRTGMVFGTPHYMSPEQAAGQTVDGRTDVYALGIIMYEMLVGRVPFDADTFMGILSKHMFEPPTSPVEAAAGRDLGGFEAVVLKALAKKPEERHQSMEELIEDLHTVTKGGQIAVPRPSHPSSGPAFGGEEVDHVTTQHDLVGPRRGPSARVLAVAGGLALFAGTGIAVAWAVSGGSDERDAGSAAVKSDADGASSESASKATGGDPAEPPIDPQENPTEHAEPTAAAAGEVALSSEPAGAQVLSGEVLVGNTPIRVPRPARGKELTLELRMPGYEARSILLTVVSPESLHVELERERARMPRRSRARRQGTARAPRPSQAAAPQRAQDTPDTSAADEPPVIRQPTEVLDPWDQ